MDGTKPTVDFDQHGEFYAANWREQLADMRNRCPVAWTEAHGGFWVITKHEDIMHIERHPEIFSCDNDLQGTRAGGKGIRIPSSLIRFSLNESDPPEHTALRKLEAPFFSVKALQSWMELAREVVDEQINSVIEAGSADLVHDITIPVPAQVTLRLVGVPVSQWRDFMATSLTAYLPPNHPDFPNAERARIAERLEVLMVERKADRREDVISALVHAEIDGKPLPHETAKGMLQSLLFGGFDTTAATAGNALYWLEHHPELHRRLIDDDKFLEKAVDEFLRVFPPLVGGLSRTVTQPTELRGQQIKKGDRVLLMFNSGNLDAERFECPDEVRLERSNARQNLAFGAGPHRCLGSVLGMSEVGIIVRAVLKRLPDYRIDREKARRVPRMGGVNGWLTMPIRFTPGQRRGRS
jgi:cytochrome P450